ncbi:hypothetical protein PHYSODRAFT_333507 [Phytophthora sojae]|uniref:Uncharacterized protein n=1 Tax=Phytophthora sojae (strain P6497) TaxID=1094619 RepID=G4ZL17_PHYSP|nr:hypothetical protein PHYSODRAFT_333507 [Phytophthora sojae]EGZ15239.1 hypothetical protein PHYSODRAFT_333507 [Phytophthora sojae]|eukprot:XP_009528988.1 hypothetical protein PHYSODRAFT_333507 [Phytophthora sojae]
MPSKGKARASTATTKEVEEEQEQEEKASGVVLRPHMTDEEVQGVLVAAQVFVYPPDDKKKAGQVDVTYIADLYDRCPATIRKIIDRKPRIGSGRVPIHDPAVLAQCLRSLPPNLSGRQKARYTSVAPSTLARLRVSIEQELAEATTVHFKAANRSVRIEMLQQLCRDDVTEVWMAYYAVTDCGFVDVLVWLVGKGVKVYVLFDKIGITATLDDLVNLVARNPVGSEAGDVTIVVSDKELKFVEGEAGKLGLQEWCEQERELAMLCGQNAVVLAAERPPIRDLDAHGLLNAWTDTEPTPRSPTGPFQALQTTAANLERDLDKLKPCGPGEDNGSAGQAGGQAGAGVNNARKLAELRRKYLEVIDMVIQGLQTAFSFCPEPPADPSIEHKLMRTVRTLEKLRSLLLMNPARLQRVSLAQLDTVEQQLQMNLLPLATLFRSFEKIRSKGQPRKPHDWRLLSLSLSL